MRFRWPASLAPLAGFLSAESLLRRRKYDLRAAPEFIFKARPLGAECTDRTPGERSQPGVSGQAPYVRTRRESLTLSRNDVPALTIASGPSEHVQIAGMSRNDWSLRFCAYGEGENESQALERLREHSLKREGGTVFMNGPGIGQTAGTRGNLLVEAPADAPITIHASFAPVEVRDMTGPVRVTAIHGRAVFLNTTGRVDAASFVVDFAGSAGTVILSAEAEINLKLTAHRFQGSLTAWAQGPVRVLCPAAFQTPFQAIVNRREDFVCRTALSAHVEPEKRGGVYVFTYRGDASTSTEAVHLRSEHAAVIIDGA